VNQNEIFSAGEGDSWFRRNEYLQTLHHADISEDVRYISSFLKPFQQEVHKVLEIGCCSGVKLETICGKLDAIGIGIEPSTIAVDVGNRRKKNVDVTLQVGTGDELPFEDSEFDLVYFAFCLYLFDRKTLMQAFSEADRVLKSGGFLVITDFDPGFIHKRPYSHIEQTFSYKQNYSDFYTSSGLYYLVGKHCFSHKQSFFDECHDERISTSILYKEVNSYPSCP
jgi:ubiquinone/menaquinone biosynthesis C-methylase UbiE